MAQELSPGRAEDLSSRLAESQAFNAFEFVSSPSPRERMLLERLVVLWKLAPDVPPACVGYALLAASRTANQVAALQTIELAWTGPSTNVVPARRIDQALFEVVMSAERELLVVSYAVFNVPVVLNGLNAAIGRGVDVDLVLEFEGPEGEQSYDPLAALHGLNKRVRVFYWPFASRPAVAPGKRGFIHVKAAVADRNVALISSANLTSYALEANMELGVLIRGASVPGRIARHFGQLIQDGILEPWRG